MRRTGAHWTSQKQRLARWMPEKSWKPSQIAELGILGSWPWCRAFARRTWCSRKSGAESCNLDTGERWWIPDVRRPGTEREPSFPPAISLLDYSNPPECLRIVAGGQSVDNGVHPSRTENPMPSELTSAGQSGKKVQRYRVIVLLSPRSGILRLCFPEGSLSRC
jgi:hypothetical protein